MCLLSISIFDYANDSQMCRIKSFFRRYREFLFYVLKLLSVVFLGFFFFRFFFCFHQTEWTSNRSHFCETRHVDMANVYFSHEPSTNVQFR